MKKLLCLLLAAALAAVLTACGAAPAPVLEEEPPAAEPAGETAAGPDRDYRIRIYTDCNTARQTAWLVNEARAAGFSIRMDDDSVLAGAADILRAADEGRDGDVLFGFSAPLWAQLLHGRYENLTIAPWTPSWDEEVDDGFKFPGYAYGLTAESVVLLLRTDGQDAEGETPGLDHWADIPGIGDVWSLPGATGGAVSAAAAAAVLYPFADPDSPAGGIAPEGWKALWAFCAGSRFPGTDGAELLNAAADAAILSSGSLFGPETASGDDAVLRPSGPSVPEGWTAADIADGVCWLDTYLGILDRADRSPGETAAVEAFAEWLGSAEIQAAWCEEFGAFPCNSAAAEELYPDGTPALLALPDLGRDPVAGADMTYAEYVGVHGGEWTDILVSLGFYGEDAPAEPDWEELDWAALTGAAG